MTYVNQSYCTYYMYIKKKMELKLIKYNKKIPFTRKKK